MFNLPVRKVIVVVDGAHSVPAADVCESPFACVATAGVLPVSESELPIVVAT